MRSSTASTSTSTSTSSSTAGTARRSVLSLCGCATILAASSVNVQAFTFMPTSRTTSTTTHRIQSQSQSQASTTTSLWMAKGKKSKSKSKGFGSPSTDVAPSLADEPVAVANSADAAGNEISTVVPDNSALQTSTSSQAQAQPSAPTMTAGQKTLQKLREKRQAEKDDELRRVKNLQVQDTIFQTDVNAAVIPEKVAMRMGKRMLPFVAVPIFGGMATFVGFWYMATYQNQEYQPAVVAVTTIGLLVVGLIGITYSVMSASWDPEAPEGSVLGFEEFGTNLSNLREGLGRSKDNAQLREKMNGLPESEVQAALRDLERREKKAEKKAQSYSEKMKEEGL